MRETRFEELVSAFIDGELSSGERLAVERELAQSDELKQLFDQLLRQRQILQAAPRVSAPRTLADRIVRHLEESKTSQPSVAVREARREIRVAGRRRFSLNVLLGVASVVAAGFLITMVTRNEGIDNPLKPPVNNLTVEPSFVARLGAFQEKFQHLLVYDIAITPKGRRNNVFDQWLKAANIQIERSVTIEEKLEQGVLESRFIGDDKIIPGADRKDVARDDVEMILVRAKSAKISAILEEWYKIRDQTQDEAHLRMDMAIAPKELEIFLRLNDAVDGEGALRQVSSDSWTTPGAYRLNFRLALHSTSPVPLGAASTPKLTPVVQAETSPPVNFAVNKDKTKRELENEAGAKLPAVPAMAGVFGGDEPSQVLIIVRNLKEDVTFPAMQGPAFDRKQ